MDPDGGTGMRIAEDDDSDPEERWLVLNPESGDGGHRERVRRLAEERGYTVRETQYAGHAPELAREAAAADADLVAAAGGDGTLNGVVSGLDDADALPRTVVGVVPVGTANIFADLVGVEGVEHAFEVLADGRERRVDLGTVEGGSPGDGSAALADDPRSGRDDADDDDSRGLFVLSSLAGLPAEASLATSSALKSRLGTVAFVATALREAIDFDGIHLSVEAVVDGEETTWEGDALVALVGNLRGFGPPRARANAEDGLLDAVIVERMPTRELLAEAATGDLFDPDADHARHFRSTSLEIDAANELAFSVDGERLATDHLSVGVRPGVLRIKVGPDYDAALPNPDD
ncbi:diacylglycerol/lipid kinase family protein [Halobium salinum]|uniref:Diacylglycerol/lipid kinase family protein n=1 Tax=Halobium salinum TaxID=1364940 RepID=A0ABD5PA12_9EURY|nr:diacylglycerol kinase family protein [Halobium salinum]